MSSIARRITQWKNSEVEAVFKKTHRLYKGPECDIRVARTTNEIGRLLLIVSRKTGTAPQRNLFKRRLKSLFFQEHLYSKGYDWIIFAKLGGIQTTFDRLKDIMKQAQDLL